MMRSRGGVLLVVACVVVPLGTGTAGADPVVQEKDTIGGYHLRLSMDPIAIQSVPNMAAAPLVREGFISATSRLEVTCRQENKVQECPEDPISTTLELRAQVGCPFDLSGGLPLQPGANLSSSIPGLNLGQLFPNDPTGITNIALTPTVQNLGLGQLNVTLKPGFINDFDLGVQNIPASQPELDSLQKAVDLAQVVQNNLDRIKMSAEQSRDAKTQSEVDNTQQDIYSVRQRTESILNRKATGQDGGLTVSVQNRHIVVDRHTDVNKDTWGACGGPVAIRLYAVGTITATTNGKTSSDKVNIYSDIGTL